MIFSRFPNFFIQKRSFLNGILRDFGISIHFLAVFKLKSMIPIFKKNETKMLKFVEKVSMIEKPPYLCIFKSAKLVFNPLNATMNCHLSANEFRKNA